MSYGENQIFWNPRVDVYRYAQKTGLSLANREAEMFTFSRVAVAAGRSALHCTPTMHRTSR